MFCCSTTPAIGRLYNRAKAPRKLKLNSRWVRQQLTWLPPAACHVAPCWQRVARAAALSAAQQSRHEPNMLGLHCRAP